MALKRDQFPVISGVRGAVEPGGWSRARGSDIYGIGARGSDSDGADAGEADRIADASPRLAAIECLPDTASGGAEVVHRRVTWHPRGGGGLAGAKRSYEPPLDSSIEIGIYRLSE